MAGHILAVTNLAGTARPADVEGADTVQLQQIVNGTEFSDTGGTSARLVREIEGGQVRYLVTRGRSVGAEKTASLASFAAWAAHYVR